MSLEAVVAPGQDKNSGQIGTIDFIRQEDSRALPPELGLFDSIFHEVDEAIAIVTLQNETPQIVDINAQFQRQTGHSKPELQGSNLLNLLKCGRGTESLATLTAAFHTKTPSTLELRIRCKKLSIPAKLTIRPYSGSPKESRFVCIFRLQSAAIRQEQEAAKDITNRLLTFLSHDLRTPLNGILGFSEIMMSGILGPLDPASYRDYARDIHAAGQDLLRFINGLLDLSYSESSLLTLHESTFSLVPSLDACIDALRNKAHVAGLSIHRSMSRENLMFRGDEARIRQVILILLSNAISFTPAGGRISLSVRLKPYGIDITCRDNGIGISKNELLCAFQPYRRIEDTYTNPRAGIGVGLPLIKVLIEQHDGRVSIKSAEGRGTAVTIRLPHSRLLLAE